MKRATKYVLLVVHQSTTVGTVREEGGRVIARMILTTEEKRITAASWSLESVVASKFDHIATGSPGCLINSSLKSVHAHG